MILSSHNILTKKGGNRMTHLEEPDNGIMQSNIKPNIKDSTRTPQILTTTNKKGRKKGEIFSCNICNFKCSYKYHWERHITTDKHKCLMATNKKREDLIYHCNCGKKYKHLSSLCNHRKKCTYFNTNPLEKIENNIEYFSEDNDLSSDESIEITNNHIITNTDDYKIDIDSSTVIEIIKQNQDFKNLLIEQREMMMEQNNKIMEQNAKLIEITKQTPVIINQTNNQTNNFNLNFFLYEQCKNALNIQEFLDNIQLNVSDIEATGRLGYVNGISRILINKLKEIDIYSRPLHCTDYKRETVYIKNENAWEKEDSEKPTLKQIVKIVAKKNLRQLSAWQEENPDFKDVATPKNDEFVKISLSCLGSSTVEEDEKDTNKILRNVLKEVVIDKGQ